MTTVHDDLEHCQITIELALTELMAGRTFYSGYFEGKDWIDLSRADRAICILQSHLGNQELGDPKGFDEVRQHIQDLFLKKKEEKGEE